MVTIQFNCSKRSYKDHLKECVEKKCLSRYIKKLCGKKHVSINYNFVSSSEQIKMNTEFKDHTYNTDILTFDLSPNPCELTGDVYISLKQVKKNAKNYHNSLQAEINRVLIHGYLHLAGYNDESKKEIIAIRKEEDRYLKYISKKCSTWNNN